MSGGNKYIKKELIFIMAKKSTIIKLKDKTELYLKDNNSIFIFNDSENKKRQLDTGDLINFIGTNRGVEIIDKDDVTYVISFEDIHSIKLAK